MATVLLTGAAGYIASHTWLALLDAGHDVVGIDDFSNSSPRVLDRLARLAARPPDFERADVCDAAALDRLFGRRRIDAVVHFAAFKAVGESARQAARLLRQQPRRAGRRCAARCSARLPAHRLQFQRHRLRPARDAADHRGRAPLAATNPYGRTKLVGEQILRDLGAADAGWRTACLRYFNPVGAHPSGLIGEDPRGTPNNLMPYVAQVAVGRRAQLQVFGDDYRRPTAPACATTSTSSTWPRAMWRRCAICSMAARSLTVNLGTGRGYSVLELVRAYEQASGRDGALRDRRPPPGRRGGLLRRSVAGPRAAGLAGAARAWTRMCEDSWRWQQANPQGFAGSAG